MTSGFVDVEGGRIFHETRGEGPDVVLIHAGYLDSRMWDREMERYAEDHRVTRYDVRGYGRSTKPTGPYSDGGDLLALLDHVGAEKAVLVGVSNGGRIALDLAVEHPERVAGLVLMNFGCRGYEPEDDQEMAQWKAEEALFERFDAHMEADETREAAAAAVGFWTSRVDLETRERLVAIASDNVGWFMEDTGEHQVRPDVPAFKLLDRLTMPVLMLVGDQDVEGQITMNRRIHERVPGSSFHLVPGADHVPSLSTPDAFDEHVGPFLAKLAE